MKDVQFYTDILQVYYHMYVPNHEDRHETIWVIVLFYLVSFPQCRQQHWVTTAHDNLSDNKSGQILATTKNVDAREDLATQIKKIHI